MSMINSGGLHSLSTLIKRLEAAASRFEDIADLPLVLDPSRVANHPSAIAPSLSGATVHGRSSQQPPAPQSVPKPAAAASAPAPSPSPSSAETPKIIVSFKADVINTKLKPFVEFTKGFAGPNVIDTVSLVEKQFDILMDFLTMASACQKPSSKVLESLLTPFSDSITAVSRAKEVHRRDRDWFSHVTIIAEGAPSIAWVVHEKPPSFFADLKDSVVYYGNKVKKEYKEKDPKHVEWVNHYLAILDAMQAYVKEYYTTGLSWNPKGIAIEQYQALKSSSSAAPPAPSPSPAVGPAAVFAELNRGEEVTKGLRKVDKSEMTHKNPALRASSIVPASTPAPPPSVGRKPIKPSKPQALAGKKPPKFLQDGSKWIIEFQENETLTVENVEISHVVNIFGCKGTTIIIKGKVNAVNIINSSKTSVLVQSVISAVTVTASPSFQIQITGSAPMIQLDSTDSGQIYLSKDSLHTEITTAKCSAINVSLPVEGEEEGIFEEQPIPEMFKTTVKDGKLVTTLVEHSG